MRISTKTFSLMAVGLFAVGLSVGAGMGCGSSSSTDYVSLCTRSCNKYVMCMPSAGISASDCSTICAKAGNKSSCPNADQVAAAANNCLAMADCTAYLACSDSAPQCGSSGGTGTGGSTGTTGTGGSSSGAGTGGHATGTGGSTGAAGSGGTADCSICDKANTCCMAEATMFGQPTSSCTFSATTCTASGSNSSTYAMSCQQILTAGQSLSIAACQ